MTKQEATNEVMRAGRRGRARAGRSLLVLMLFAVGAVSIPAAPAAPRAAGAPKRPAAAAPSSPAPSGAQGGDTKPGLVDVNSAGADRLAELPGIGPSIAQRIVDYRKEHGPFKSVEDLLNVRGIGERSLARFRDRVTVGSRD